MLAATPWRGARRTRVGLLAVVITAVLLPVCAIIGYLLSTAASGSISILPVLVIGLGVAFLSGGVVLLALRLLLAPLAVVITALREARGATTPGDTQFVAFDSIGELLGETHHTLNDFTATIARLEHEAATDPLTGQLNRRAGEARLQAALAGESDADVNQIAVVLVDVDGLKTVNDRWGHAAGDAALSHLAAVLSQHVADRGWVARWGGDEFLVVFTEAAGSSAAEQLLAEVAADIAAKPIAVTHDGRARLGVSWGLAWPAPGEPGPTVISRADAALYRAKQLARLEPVAPSLV